MKESSEQLWQVSREEKKNLTLPNIVAGPVKQETGNKKTALEACYDHVVSKI